MDISPIIVIIVIGLIVAFGYYLVDVTRAYNQKQKQLRQQGPAQVIQSMLEMLDSEGNCDQLLAAEQSANRPEELEAIIDRLNRAFRIWADLARYVPKFSVRSHDCFVDETGKVVYYVIVVKYALNDGQVFSTLLYCHVGRLATYVNLADAHLHVLQTMSESK